MKIDWTNRLIELVVVFIGITAAFGLDNYREAQTQRELERKYIHSLQGDLRADKQQLESLVAESRSSLKQVAKLANLSNGAHISNDSLAVYASGMFRFQRFRPSRITYDALSGSGDLTVLTSFELKHQLAELYSLYEQTNEQDAVGRDHVNKYIVPYFYENFDLRNLNLLKRDALTKPMFSNLIQGNLVTANQSFRMYQECLEECRDLLLHLEDR